MQRVSRLFVLSVVLLTITGAPNAWAGPNNVNPIPGLNGISGLPHLTGRTQAVAQVTGLGGMNDTVGDNVLGTDLGVMWDNGNGQILTAFGDSAGLGVPNLLQGSVWSWKSNFLVRSSDHNLADGMTFDSIVRDPIGQAKELVPSPKIPFVEISRIPTAGVAVGGVQYMNLMSVKDWGTDGKWNTNFSGLAVSTDNGENWTDAPETHRPSALGNFNFQQSAYLEDGGYVYQYGTPPGRGNLAFVSRVKENDIRNLGEYEYWSDHQWVKGDPNVSTPIVFGGVGELSVSYNAFLGQYIMLTTDNANSITMRTSPTPVGSWSAPQVLLDTRELPSAYAPYIHPFSTGSDLYFLATVYQNYNVLLLKTRL